MCPWCFLSKKCAKNLKFLRRIAKLAISKKRTSNLHIKVVQLYNENRIEMWTEEVYTD